MAYTASNSVLRAKRLQSLCASEDLSALIFILGIDSRRNRLDEQVYYWLFQGASGQENLSSVSLPLNLEEIAFIITPDSFHIYVGSALNDPVDTQQILTSTQEISASWPGVSITTITKEEVLDSELAENTKLLWFNRTMGKILGKVGMCSGDIEMWPLIQGYAIDLFGLGFFSMSHSVVDISKEIEPLFLEFDDAGVLAVVNEHLPRLCGVFQQTIDFINKRYYAAGRGELTEALIAECVTLPFEYATLQSNKVYKTQPYVRLFTDNGSLKCHSAHHMVCMGACAISGIMCARTWFFVPCGGVKEFILYDQQDDLHGLLDIYKAVSKAVRTGISEFSSESAMKERILFELFKEKVLIKYHHMLEAIRNAEITFTSFDADGISREFTESLPMHSVLFKASDINSKTFSNFGDLIFGESFIYRNNQVLLITESVEDVVVWENQTKKPWQSPYGERLSSIEHAEIYIESLGVYEGTLLIYESGWAFRSINLGQLEYSLDEFSKIEQHSPEAISFFLDSLRIVIKVSSRSSIVLASVWRVQYNDSQAPEFPQKKSVNFQVHEVQRVTEDPYGIPVYLMTGVAGSGKTIAAKDIARGLKISCIIPDLTQSASFDKNYWMDLLSNITRTCIIVIPSYISAYQILPLLPSNVYAKTIICKFCAKNVHLSERKVFIPGLIHLVQNCNSLIFEESESSNELFKLCGLMNSVAEVFRINGRIGPSQARNIVSVEQPLPIQRPYTPNIPLQSVFINVPLPLLESKIKQRLANTEISDEGSLAKRINYTNDMEIIRIKGCVELFNKDQGLYEISGNPYYLQSTPTESKCQGILFIGRNLDTNKLYEFVLDCRSHVNKMPLKSRKLLTQSEISAIEADLAENSEYIFDGLNFVDSMGKKFKVNPDLEQALLDYVERENEKIGSINRGIEKERSVLKKANPEVLINSVFG